MPVFKIEIAIFELSKLWPQDGFLFKFFTFWSHFSQSGWLLIIPLFFIWKREGIKMLWIQVVGAAISVGLGDLISRRVFKELIMRPRPHFLGQLCDQSSCWGFVSSHSTNTAALLTFICLMDRRHIFWAVPIGALVGFSRIFLQAHFLFDVLGGYILGICLGGLVHFIFSKYLAKFIDVPSRQH